MKSFCIFTVLFLVVGLFSVAAQDLIIFRDGSIIEAKVTKISPTEIQYKRFDQLEGPTIVIYANNVLSIRYENGRVDNINPAPIPMPIPKQKQKQTENPQRETAIDPNKFIFGINFNTGGAASWVWGNGGANINFELGKGNFNTEINLFAYPYSGALVTFNYFGHSKIGGGYIGGGIGGGYSFIFYSGGSLTLGFNMGYKFVTPSGAYFRTGAFVGYDFFLPMGFFIKPDLSIGWTMR